MGSNLLGMTASNCHIPTNDILFPRLLPASILRTRKSQFVFHCSNTRIPCERMTLQPTLSKLCVQTSMKSSRMNPYWHSHAFSKTHKSPDTSHKFGVHFSGNRSGNQTSYQFLVIGRETRPFTICWRLVGKPVLLPFGRLVMLSQPRQLSINPTTHNQQFHLGATQLQ